MFLLFTAIFIAHGINYALKNITFTFKVRVENYMKGETTRVNMWDKSSSWAPGRLM